MRHYDDLPAPEHRPTAPEDIAAAELATAAAELAAHTYGIPTESPADCACDCGCNADPMAEALEALAAAKETGLPPELARADVVILAYFTAAAEAIAAEMGADFAADEKRFFTLAALDWVENRSWDDEVAILDDRVPLTAVNCQE